MAETLIPFLLSTMLSPAGFIGFCCGLSRAVPAVLGGAIFATALETFLALAVSTDAVDPLYILMMPLASVIASAIGWGVARLFFGPRNKVEQNNDESTRLAYKHDILDHRTLEDY